MDIGFTIDTDKAGETQYLTFALPFPEPDGGYTIDLLETVWRMHGTVPNPHLIGIDLFPHKAWWSGALKQDERINYSVNSIQLASTKSSIILRGECPPRNVTAPQSREASLIYVDDQPLPIQERPDHNRGEIQLYGNLALREGTHCLRVQEKRAFQVYLVEIKPSMLSRPAPDYKSGAYEIKKLNPTKYIATVMTRDAPSTLILDQNFNAEWKAMLHQPGQAPIPLKTHFEVDGYANGWEVPESKVGTKIVMEYTPQQLLSVGVLLSLLSLLGCLLYLMLTKGHNGGAQ